MALAFSVIAFLIYMVLRALYDVARNRARYWNIYADAPPTMHSTRWQANVAANGRHRIGLVKARPR